MRATEVYCKTFGMAFEPDKAIENYSQGLGTQNAKRISGYLHIGFDCLRRRQQANLFDFRLT